MQGRAVVRLRRVRVGGCRVLAAAGLAALAQATALRAQPVAPARDLAHATPAERVEVVICESHDRVLAHWLRAASEARIPTGGVAVVHFDAHPDLAVPKRPVQRGWPRHPGLLMSSVDIASFQLAAVRIGLVDRIAWLRPSWASQLPDGVRRFHVGLAEGGVRVDDPSDYYVLDESWAPLGRLADPVRLELSVLSLEAAGRAAFFADAPVIFDIDLDGFATRNPAADRLREAGLSDADLARIRGMFAPERLGFAVDPETRIAELGELTRALDALASLRIARLPGAVAVLWRRGLGPGDLYALYEILSRAGEAAAFEVLLEDGRQVVGSPEHRAVPAEIAHTAHALADLLRSGAVRPALVTIARSVEDGFTPPDSWPAIEATLLLALREALGDFEPRYDAGISAAPPATRGESRPPRR